MESTPIAMSLFSGAGGCSLGFTRAGYRIIYALDFDRRAISTYRGAFSGTPTDVADIREVNWQSLMRRLDLAQGELDILIGGPPCQGFSTAGTRFWDDPRNSLLKCYVTALENLRPKWFLMENVEGLLTAKHGDYVFEATKAFIELGYTIRIEKVYAHEFGIPQRRKRVLVVGNSLGREFTMPRPLICATGAIFRKGAVTLDEAIAGLPATTEQMNSLLDYDCPAENDLERYYRKSCSGVSCHHTPKVNGVQYERIRALHPGQTMKDLPPELQHASFKRRAMRRVKDGTPSEKRGGAPSGLKRLFFDEPCLTITGAATRELIHPTEHRPLTIRECARIQTFPDTFHPEGTSAQQIQQIGNAIPPLLADLLGRHILNCGFEGPSDSGEGRLLGFSLTKACAMSPALARTRSRLLKLMKRPEQATLFESELL
jgi:DNA (cytosine-5)-methyltransferase 1